MFRKTNLKKALEVERNLLQEKEEALVLNAFEILNEEVYIERDIRHRVDSSERYPSQMYFGLDHERIFSEREIKSLCIKYRLRFLDSSKFQNELPYEVVKNLKELEKKNGQRYDSFKIVATAEAFVLEDCDKDPIFFINLGLNKFYLVHQWGNDMSWYRKLLCLPIRSFKTLAISILALSLLISAFVPTDFISSTVMGKSAVFARLAFFLWSLITISATVTYFGLTFFKSPSSHEWNSPFFKQHY